MLKRNLWILLAAPCLVLACSAGSPSPAANGADSGSAAGTTTGGSRASAGASGSRAAGAAGLAASGAAGASAAGASLGGAAGAGGASGTAGSADAAGASGPPPSTIIVQDNFDSGSAKAPPSATKWAGYPQGQESSAPVIDTQRAHSGSNAALVTSTSSGLGAFLVPVTGLPVPANKFYVRVYINWEKSTTQISGHSGFMVAASARDESGTELRLGVSSKGPNGVPRMDLNLQNPKDGGETTRYSNGFNDGGDPSKYSDTGWQFTANTWYCVEALFDGTSGASQFQAWIDGKEITALHVTDFRDAAQIAQGGTPRTNWAPSYNFIKIGANDYDANLGHIWYDDVVVATQPIGCSYVVR